MPGGDELLESDKRVYKNLMDGRGNAFEYATSVVFLSSCLKKYHGQNVVILLDEYDVPLENAYFREYKRHGGLYE